MGKKPVPLGLIYLLAVTSLLLSFLIFLTTPVAPYQSEEFPLQEEAIHWHARLRIVINGQDIPIPANVGITPEGAEILHTHAWDNVIHIHAPDLSSEHRALGRFFEIWGVPFSKNCLFQYCNGELRMEVNGISNNDFHEYMVQDQDDIVITMRTF